MTALSSITRVLQSPILKWMVGSMMVLSFVVMLSFNIFPDSSPLMFGSHHARILSLIHDQYVLTVLLYIGLYGFLAALSLPGKLMLTLAGGYLFGTVLGTIYILWGATVGASLAFLGTRYLFREVAQETLGRQLPLFKETVKSYAFTTLLLLRLLPIVPFTLLNLLAGLTPMKFNTFLGATMIGMLPCTFLLSYLGSRLPRASSLTWEWSSPALPLAALTILVLLVPALHHGIRHRKSLREDSTTCRARAWSGALNQSKPFLTEHSR